MPTREELREKILEKLDSWFTKLGVDPTEKYVISSMLYQKSLDDLMSVEEEDDTEEEIDEDLDENTGSDEFEDEDADYQQPKKQDRQRAKVEAMQRAIPRPIVKRPIVNIKGRGNTPSQKDIDGGSF